MWYMRMSSQEVGIFGRGSGHQELPTLLELSSTVPAHCLNAPRAEVINGNVVKDISEQIRLESDPPLAPPHLQPPKIYNLLESLAARVATKPGGELQGHSPPGMLRKLTAEVNTVDSGLRPTEAPTTTSRSATRTR